MLGRFGVLGSDGRCGGGRADRRARPRPDVGTDAALLHYTAAWLRADADAARAAGLDRAEDARALTALLDLIAAELPHVAPDVRSAAVAWCRAARDEPDA